MGAWVIAPAAPDVDGNPMIGNGPLKRLRAVGLGNATFAIRHHGHGRDGRCQPPPVQIPACAANAPGSSLGFWRRSGDKAAGV
jgi:hypothetical protein